MAGYAIELNSGPPFSLRATIEGLAGFMLGWGWDSKLECLPLRAPDTAPLA